MNDKNKYKDIVRSTLYIVPTPIGNREDITQRALSVLQKVDLIAAEDTRHTGLLLQYFSIKKKLFSLNNYNERKKTDILLLKLKYGKKSIALVSNAGTPLISDPGYYIVRCCHKYGIRVVPLPGACAAITALSASGLPSHHFCYEGFLPRTRHARFHSLQMLAQEQRTLIFYESTHRLLDTLKDMENIFGPLRYVVLMKELTKIWETIYGAPIKHLLEWIQEDDMRRRGEIVLIVEGYKKSINIMFPSDTVWHNTLSLLLNELPIKKAITLTAKIHNIKRNTLYRYLISLKKNTHLAPQCKLNIKKDDIY